MKVSIIAAMDQKRGIGKDNKIPWRIKEDLVHLKGLTLGKIVILGRKSYDSMVWYYNKTGNPMPGKLYLVVTREKSYVPARDNGKTVSSIEEAISKAKEIGEEEVFIIGGQQIFQQTIGLANKLYLTIVEARLDSPPESPARRGEFDADTFFPDYSSFKKVVFEESHASGGYKYKFLELER